MAKTIMVIDDSKSIRKTVGFILHEEGYNVVESSGSLEALNKLEENEIDLILCDVNMPEIDGIAFLNSIKNDKKYSSYRFTPIIMLTTETGNDMKEKGKKLGAKAWIVKPFKPDHLIDAIKKLII